MSAEENEWEIVSTWKMLSYSFGFLVYFSIYASISVVIFYYYEVEIGMPVVLLGLALAIYGLYNMFNDPILGYLTDRPFRWTRKWGMRFPWIMLGIFPTIIGYYFLIAVPENLITSSDPWPLFWYLLISLCLIDTFFSIFSVHISGGVANHFRTEYERRRFAAISNTIPFLLALPLGMIIPFIVVYGKRETFVLAASISTLFLLVFAIMFIPGVRESENLKESFIKSYESTTKTFWKTLKIGLGRKNFAISLIVVTLYYTAVTLYIASSIYFMKDILKLPLIYSIFTNIGYYIGFVIGVPIWANYAKKNGFRKTYVLGLLMLIFCFLPILWITTIEETVVFGFIYGFFAGCVIIMFVPIASDCYDEISTFTGTRDEATLQGIRNFFITITYLVYGPIIAIVHIAFGYNPDPSATQTPLAIWGIRVHMGLIPMILMCLAFFIAYKWYDLEGEKKQEVIAKLKSMGL